MTGKEGEQLAAQILPGEAIRKPQPLGADVWWEDQQAWVEVKTTNVQPYEIGRRYLRVDLRRSWGRNDYYMIMIAAQNKLERAYLIPSPELESALGERRSLTIPHDRIPFQFDHHRIV